jgi:hypothetical protein
MHPRGSTCARLLSTGVVMVNARFARATWGLVAFLLAVVAWGAFVRATGSGAGCGAHWPVCNGEVVPRAPALETLIEFGHRVSSGDWRSWPGRSGFRRLPGHRVRQVPGRVAGHSREGAIGAALVLLTSRDRLRSPVRRGRIW